MGGWYSVVYQSIKLYGPKLFSTFNRWTTQKLFYLQMLSRGIDDMVIEPKLNLINLCKDLNGNILVLAPVIRNKKGHVRNSEIATVIIFKCNGSKMNLNECHIYEKLNKNSVYQNTKIYNEY